MTDDEVEMGEERTYSREEMFDILSELKIAQRTIRDQQTELQYMRARPRRTADDEITIQAAIEFNRRVHVYLKSVPERVIRILVSQQNLVLTDTKDRMRLYQALTKELDTGSLLKPSALLKAIGAHQ